MGKQKLSIYWLLFVYVAHRTASVRVAGDINNQQSTKFTLSLTATLHFSTRRNTHLTLIADAEDVLTITSSIG